MTDDYITGWKANTEYHKALNEASIVPRLWRILFLFPTLILLIMMPVWITNVVYFIVFGISYLVSTGLILNHIIDIVDKNKTGVRKQWEGRVPEENDDNAN